MSFKTSNREIPIECFNINFTCMSSVYIFKLFVLRRNKVYKLMPQSKGMGQCGTKEAEDSIRRKPCKNLRSEAKQSNPMTYLENVSAVILAFMLIDQFYQ